MANDSVSDSIELKKAKKENIDKNILWNVAILCETVDHLLKDVETISVYSHKIKEAESFQRLLKIKDNLKALVLSEDYMEVPL